MLVASPVTHMIILIMSTGEISEDLKAAPSTHSRKYRLLLAIISNFTNSRGIKFSVRLA